MNVKVTLSILAVAAVLVAGGATAGCSSGSGGGSASPTPTSTASPSPSPSTATQVVKVDSVAVPPAVNVKVGDKLVVQLNSNASTGYLWSVEGSGIADTGILKTIGKPVLVAPNSKLTGAPGKTRFTFQAVKKGSDQLEFWYARPSDPDNPGASYALIVNVAQGHLPVHVTATEDYTAETAQMRVGDTLVVEIQHAAASGKASWKVASSTVPAKLVGQKWSSAHGGTATLKFTGTAAGTGAMVLVNQPPGEVPLQTYALPVSVRTVKKPITVQANYMDDGESFSVKGGDRIQVTLPDQPSTGYEWQFRKLNAKVLKQVGKPKFTPNNNMIGALGKTMWTFRVVGPGKTSLIADFDQAESEGTPLQTFQIDVAAKPGYTPKTVDSVDTYPSETLTVKPGDTIDLALSAKAGMWVPQGSSKVLPNSKLAISGGKTVVTYKAVKAGVVTPVLIAKGSGGWPNQAYAFTAVIGKGKAPETVVAAERRVAKPVGLAVGDTVTFRLPGNATTGFQWVVDPYVGSAVVQQLGAPTYTPDSDIIGSPGVYSVTFKAVASGSEPLTFLYEGPGSESVTDGIYMTWVNVK